MEYDLNDIVEMKKEHPCERRSKQFQIVRMEANIKIKYLGCSNVKMLTKHNYEKNVKKIIKNQE